MPAQTSSKAILGSTKDHPPAKQELVSAFQRLVFSPEQRGSSWDAGTYFGLPLLKWPCDVQIYQELITDLKPELIIETGTYSGASALYYAHLLDQIGWGKVLSVDIRPVTSEYPRHPRISYLGGKSSVLPEVFEEVKRMAEGKGPVLVILDSDHSKNHVLTELSIYAELVSPGSYLVVEDVNLGTDLFFAEHGPGAQAALDAWLPRHPEFRIDQQKSSKYLFSTNCWLRRVRL
jgi:cephalosporin hydroxylase